MKHYYEIKDDLKKFPEAFILIVIGGRNTGKTYSALVNCYLNEHKPFIFLKRTIEDVNLLCAGGGRVGTRKQECGVDLSPFKSINRDKETTVKAFSIKNGLGGFWETNEDGEPVGYPVGYLLALNAVTKYKGFDFSECDYIIFDEFIPQPWDRINRKEGEQLMDLYKTVSRDREHRGRGALKLLCLANATEVSNPTMNVLEITDTVVQMQSEHRAYDYDEDRQILIHILYDNEEFRKTEEKSLIYKAMANTDWARMALDSDFAYNDFTNVGRLPMKGYRPLIKITYKLNSFYVYMKDGNLFFTSSTPKKYRREYNLNTENDQKLFYHDELRLLQAYTMEGRSLFEKYTYYDLIMNYKKFFKI